MRAAKGLFSLARLCGVCLRYQNLIGDNMDINQIQNIAKLARLGISEAEAREYAEQLSKALEYFQQISTINTEGVEPLITPSEIEIYLREDHEKREYSAEEMVANSPQKTGNLFTVPPVI